MNKEIKSKINTKINLKIVLRIVLAILIIINCVTIFRFSAQESNESESSSGMIIEKIIEINPLTKDLQGQEREDLKGKISKPVRKTAHFTIYCNLGLLLYLFFRTINIDNKRRIGLSVLLAFLYACTDETHQLFVAGRSGEFGDVCIDTCGALIGSMIAFGICKLVKKIRNK